MWRADDDMSTGEEQQRQVLNASVRTILLSTITDHILTTEFEVLNDGTRRLSEVRLRMYTQLVTRVTKKSATDTDYFCESFRYDKSVDNGGLAQMERLLQFGRVLSRSHVEFAGRTRQRRHLSSSRKYRSSTAGPMPRPTRTAAGFRRVTARVLLPPRRCPPAT